MTLENLKKLHEAATKKGATKKLPKKVQDECDEIARKVNQHACATKGCTTLVFGETVYCSKCQQQRDLAKSGAKARGPASRSSYQTADANPIPRSWTGKRE